MSEAVNASIGADSVIDALVEVGYRYQSDCGPAIIGPRARLRRGAIIYGDVRAGADLSVGHFALVREHTRIGDQVTIGTQVVIEGHVVIGSLVKIESQAFLPTHAIIGSRVFIGPGAALTNDRYPLRRRAEYDPVGPVLEDDVSLGARCVLLPGVRIGQGSMVAAGAVVTKDVPPWHLVAGVPGRASPLADSLREENWARSWKR